jgi:hypothetical protein
MTGFNYVDFKIELLKRTRDSRSLLRVAHVGGEAALDMVTKA